jgi:hypothetical protein
MILRLKILSKGKAINRNNTSSLQFDQNLNSHSLLMYFIMYKALRLKLFSQTQHLDLELLLKYQVMA